jgi:hypothetical protein
MTVRLDFPIICGELEVNYEYWPNGEHQGLSQVLLTPGIIFGRFKIGMDSPTRPINLIVGAGYQVAVTLEFHALANAVTTGGPAGRGGLHYNSVLNDVDPTTPASS